MRKTAIAEYKYRLNTYMQYKLQLLDEARNLRLCLVVALFFIHFLLPEVFAEVC